MSQIELGLGLIGIGRTWGHVPGEVPRETEVMELLEFAAGLGIRYFDTAPSYGLSEERLGRFLGTLSGTDRARLTIATKFGEHWDRAADAPFVDHSYESLCRSLDRSLHLLGRIDVLQLHKTSPEVLASDDLARAFHYAETAGIKRYGASVSDLESARLTLADPNYKVMQLPFNSANPKFSDAVDQAAARGIWLATNRPFAMGAMLYNETPPSKTGAFRFILERGFQGVVLTGTRSPRHLQENWDAFEEARLSIG